MTEKAKEETDLRDHAALDQLAAEAAEAEPEGAAGPGPEPSAGELVSTRQPQGPDPETVAVVYAALAPVAAVMFPNWQLQDGELRALAEGYAGLLDYYFPDTVSDNPWVGAITATAAVAGPRLMQRIPPRDPPKPPPKRPPDQGDQGQRKPAPEPEKPAPTAQGGHEAGTTPAPPPRADSSKSPAQGE